MMPSIVVIVDAFALTPNGKIDRRALPAPSRARARGATEGYRAPADEVEAKIAAVWQELLNLERISTHDNLFDLGANSLLMMQSIGKLATALGKDLSLVEMFRFTTVSSLATYVSRTSNEAPSFQEGQDRARTRKDAMIRRRELRQDSR
jgi:acyl carrier protein